MKKEEIENEAQKPELNRTSLLGNPKSKREFGLLGLFLLSLGAIALMVIIGNKDKEQIAEAEEKFEVAASKPISLPKPKVSPPVKVIEIKKEDKRDEALLDARLKSAMVIYNVKDKWLASQGKQAHQVGLSATGPNAQFQQGLQNATVPVSQAVSLGNLENRILQGKLIDATLETAVNSDLPGMVRAVVSAHVYGEMGRRVLLPRGTRLIGQYNSSIRKGQARVFVVWTRAITPQGLEIALHSGGTDPLGRAGIKGRVNNHFWKIFGTSTLLSIIGAGAGTAGVGTDDRYNSLAAYREEVANSFRDTSSQVLERYIDIPPTIKIKHGTRIKVMVARDLAFSKAIEQAHHTFQKPYFPKRESQVPQLRSPSFPGVYNFNYKIKKAKKSGLVQAMDNGAWTYFQFRDLSKIPSIYAIESNGKESVVNWRLQEPYVVVERTAKKFILRRGKAVGKVINKAYGRSSRGASRAKHQSSRSVKL